MVAAVPLRTKDLAVGFDAGAVLADPPCPADISAGATVRWVGIGIGADAVADDLPWWTTTDAVLATHAR